MEMSNALLLPKEPAHIAAVELLFGLSDEEAVEKSREMFAARKDKQNSTEANFEVWDRACVIIQCPPPPPESEDGGNVP